MSNEKVNSGLKDIVALRSNICRIDGQNGILEYRGYNIHDLALHSGFEEIAFLLLYEKLPNAEELEKFSQELAGRRELPNKIAELIKGLPEYTHPMVILRTAISYLGSLDDKLHDIGHNENLEKAKNLLAKIPTIVAYYHRIREGKAIVKPDASLGMAANFLYMMKGEKPSEIETRALETDLILHAEHSLNASTFSARIAASTLSDMYAGIVSATGVLMGSLHGGASQEVMKMLRELKGKSVGYIKEYIKTKLEKKEKIMGFGHRVYETADPRAEELLKLANELDRAKGNNWAAICQEIAEIVYNEKQIYPNVDFYAAAVYANLEIPDDFFISIFAIARIAGWTAHMMEQYQENKLIRPLAEYSGETNKRYIPIEER